MSHKSFLYAVRSAFHSTFRLYEELFHKDISLVFLKEPHINTETYKKAVANQLTMTGDKVDLILDGVNKYLMELAREQIRIAFEQAQKEVSDLHQRTREGIETARLNGKQIGHPRGATYVLGVPLWRHEITILYFIVTSINMTSMPNEYIKNRISYIHEVSCF